MDGKTSEGAMLEPLDTSGSWCPGGPRSLWLKFFGSRYQKPGTKDTEVSSDTSVDSTVGKGVV